jgi:hypothetical protein
MLSRAWFPGERRLTPRRPVAAASLLVLVLLGCGLLLSRSSAQDPDTEKRAAAKDLADNAGLPSLEEMRRHIPPNIPPEQRKQMLRMMEEYRARMKRERVQGPGPFGGVPPGGFPPFMGVEQGSLSRLGARVEKPGATLVAQLDLPRGQGLVLEEINDNGAAAKAGLKPHDILLELDGKAVASSTEEFAQLLDKVKEDVPVNAVVLRRGKNETIKGLKLPKAEDPPAFGPGQFPPAFPQMPPMPAMPPAGLAMPANAFMPPGQPFGAPGGNGVLTTTFRSNDRFVTRHQEGSLIISVVGKAGNGKAAVQQIYVQDGRESGQYTAVDKVPELHRDKVKSLIEAVEKSNARIDVKGQ